MKPIQAYVVGFVFDETRQHVALIRKARPTWQAGLLNGIGGHVEEYDTSAVQAQRREFFEETGVDIPDRYWEKYGLLTGKGYIVDCFRAVTSDVWKVESKTDEEVVVRAVAMLQRENMIHNLSYLIPLALDLSIRNVPEFRYPMV
jgi:8-oxo-dGTP diphosphatase